MRENKNLMVVTDSLPSHLKLHHKQLFVSSMFLLCEVHWTFGRIYTCILVYSPNFFTTMMSEACGDRQDLLWWLISYYERKCNMSLEKLDKSLAVCYLKVLFPRVKLLVLGISVNMHHEER